MRKGRLVMLKRLACAVALMMFAGYSAALAADFGPPPPPPAYPGALPPPVYPIFSWTGIYVGVNGGGAFGQSNWSDAFFGTTGDFDVSGGVFGGTIGGNYQFIGTPFVVGIEGDADWTNISGTTFSPSGGCQVVGCESRSDFLATIRGRAGWAWGRALLYGTAGAAFGNIQAAAGAFPFSSTTEAGWTAGVGLEYAFWPNWTAKLEYLFVDLGTQACGPANCGAPGATSVSLNENIFRGGINFKFW
jgi:outer membrane immunogenic protein